MDVNFAGMLSSPLPWVHMEVSPGGGGLVSFRQREGVRLHTVPHGGRAVVAMVSAACTCSATFKQHCGTLPCSLCPKGSTLERRRAQVSPHLWPCEPAMPHANARGQASSVAPPPNVSNRKNLEHMWLEGREAWAQGGSFQAAYAVSTSLRVGLPLPSKAPFS